MIFRRRLRDWLKTMRSKNAVGVVVAVGGIIVQQLIHTPWGLPGHRGLFWLAPLIAARWAIDRPSTALGIAAASSTGISTRSLEARM